MRPRTAGFSAAGAIPGILLREGNPTGEVRVVLPFASFDVRESLELQQGGRLHLLVPVELEESGSNFEVGRYRESVMD